MKQRYDYSATESCEIKRAFSKYLILLYIRAELFEAGLVLIPVQVE